MTMVLMHAISGGGAAARTSIHRRSMFSGSGSMGKAMTAKVGSGRSTVTEECADLTVAVSTSVLTGLSSHGLGVPDSGSSGTGPVAKAAGPLVFRERRRETSAAFSLFGPRSARVGDWARRRRRLWPSARHNQRPAIRRPLGAIWGQSLSRSLFRTGGG